MSDFNKTVLQLAEEAFMEDNPIAAKSMQGASRERAISRYIPEAKRILKHKQASFIEGWTAHETMIKVHSGDVYKELQRAGLSNGEYIEEKKPESSLKALLNLIERVADHEGITGL